MKHIKDIITGEDMTSEANPQILASMESNNETEDVLLSKASFEQGYTMGICQCGKVFTMTPYQKWQFASNLVDENAENADETVHQIYSEGYCFLFDHCEHCSGEESIKIRDIVDSEYAGKNLLNNIELKQPPLPAF